MKQLGFLKGLISERRNLEKQFIDTLLEDKMLETIEIGRKLISIEPMFLVVSCLLNFLKDPKDNNKKIFFLTSLKKIKVKNDLIWMLCKQGLLMEELHVYIKDIGVRDHLYYLILKEIYVNGNYKLLENGNPSRCAEFLLDNLDDWDIYQHALDKGLDLKDRASLNHEYYLLHRFKDKSRAIKLLESKSCFKEIKFIAGLADLEGHPSETIDCIIKLGMNGFDASLLKRAYEIYKKDASTLNIKMLIAVLTSSRTPKFLALALYLSFLHKNTDPNSYEISLIFMFLCRYFCFYPHVLRVFSEMNVKNAQVPNLSFIWSDILIVKNIQDDGKRNEFIENMKKSITDLENGIKYLINAGNVAYVVDILNLRKTLLESVIWREVSESRIIGTNPTNSFSLLLGEHSSYIFEKMTVDKVPREKTMFLTDYYVPSSSSTDDLLSNDLCSIEDESFKSFFKDLIQYQSSISQ